MNLVLIAIVLAIGAGAVVAVSTREPAAAAIGLAVALLGAALLADPLPSPLILGVRFAAALLAAALVRWAVLGGPRQFSPVGWPAEALLATAGGIAGLGLAVGLASLSTTAEIGDGPSGGGALPALRAVTVMALVLAGGTSLLALGSAALVHTTPGPRRAIGLVLVTQAVLLLRSGVAGAPSELEEVARAGLLVAAAAAGAALARAHALAMAGEDGR